MRYCESLHYSFFMKELKKYTKKCTSKIMIVTDLRPSYSFVNAWHSLSILTSYFRIVWYPLPKKECFKTKETFQMTFVWPFLAIQNWSSDTHFEVHFRSSYDWFKSYDTKCKYFYFLFLCYFVQKQTYEPFVSFALFYQNFCNN